MIPPAAPATPTARAVAETPDPRDGVPIWTHPDWAERFPWLIQGVTAAGTLQPFDLALFGQGRPSEVLERWWALGRALGAGRLVHGHQVHGATVRVHDAGAPGLHVSPATDGHVTRASGCVLAVSIADCVPVSLVHAELRIAALLHAGWRGVAAGILERGLEVLAERMAVRASDLHVHLGPAICGRCYEVGPEVHRGLGLAAPAEPEPVDLRAVLAERAQRAGVAVRNVTSSTWCTRCGGSPFFSHRGGRAERQVAFLGHPLMPTAPAGAPHPGLCADCRHRRWTTNRRGSSFLLCELSAVDARFPKYPQLPVRACPGFDPGPPDRAGEAAKV